MGSPVPPPPHAAARVQECVSMGPVRPTIACCQARNLPWDTTAYLLLIDAARPIILSWAPAPHAAARSRCFHGSCMVPPIELLSPVRHRLCPFKTATFMSSFRTAGGFHFCS
ncbi:unnamed protein product [Staurois parvus]|uniref:Uncharacterized protein n=1 Tax=Staurois parvus TaxID=386267 RepID=A0ABN9CTZ4_9NEOB|nr:unnamed protein product [Staurois parvus]